jgi:hypothetical protein
MPVFMPTNNGEGTVELFKDCVIADREMNGYHDSDFYVVAWDKERQKLVRYEYATTRFAGGGSARVDCTPENKAAAVQWAYKTLRRRLWKEYLDMLRQPEKGDIVTVIRGRGATKGTKGKLFWIGSARVYGGYSRWSQKTSVKIGIATSDRKDEKGRNADVVWTYIANVEADPKVKFRYSEAKRRLNMLKRNAIGYWLSTTTTLPII